MDGTPCADHDLKNALHFLKITNRYFGGAAVVIKHLKNILSKHSAGPLHILDVGCGLADIPVAVARWCRKRGVPVKITALELVPGIAALAREQSQGFPEIKVLERDVLTLEDGEYDVVTASLFMHHMAESDLEPLLVKFDRLSRRGIIISDLERSRTGYSAVWALSRLIGNHVVRHDGPLSVKRSFTLNELERLATQCGLGYLSARREPFFRLSLAGVK